MTTRFAQMNARLLARYGGPATLTRVVPGALIDPEQPWLGNGPSTYITEDVPFIRTEAGVEFVSTGVIVAGDLVGIMAVPQTAELNPPKLTDLINAGGKLYTILRFEPVHSDPNGVIHYRVHGR